MLTSHDVGQRVSVRRRVEGGLTDVLGHLLDVTGDHLDVLCKGAVLSLPTADVTAAKVVPPATPRRGWEVPSVSADDMQRICWAGWPARETERLGDWALRAHDGITGRANSAMAVGDPGRPVPEALRQVASWYAERGLPALLQLPLADPANQVMADEGWPRLHVTVVQVAPIAAVLTALPDRPDLPLGRRAGAVGRLAGADARPGHRRPGGARGDPHRAGPGRFRDPLPRRRAGRHRPRLGGGRLGRCDLGRRRALGSPGGHRVAR